MKNKILTLLFALSLIAIFSRFPQAQIKLDVQPYINSSGTTIGPIDINGALAVGGIFAPTGTVTVSGNGSINFLGRAFTQSPGDGIYQVSNNAVSGFTRAIFGTNDGTSNGFSLLLGTPNAGAVSLRTGDGLSNINVYANTWNATSSFNGPGNVAGVGDIRLQNSSGPVWRNAGNTADIGPFVLAASTAGTGFTSAQTNSINYTPPASQTTYEIIGIVNVTAWTTPASFTIVATYKDGSGNARTDTAMVIRGSNGTSAAAITAVDRWYFHFPAIDTDNSQTAITLSTTGTFTGSPVYNFQATLRRNR